MTRSPLPARGLYAITDSTLIEPHRLIETVTEAIAGGAAIIQYRDKSTDSKRRHAEAHALLDCCRARRVPLIINDDVILAKNIGADGVHLGCTDENIVHARAQLGPHSIIGASCYNELQRAHQAVAQGADYIAFGSFFPSLTKPQAINAPLSLLTEACHNFNCPLVAIGGITPHNALSLLDAGADILAVISGIFAADDIHDAVRQYTCLFD